ncbi:hypothetical protein Q4503_09385 [Colwellia sp. 6_MG-2023]|uniref:hypothetical protein n=1 Tax=Colwellia sp. 6_MG-2023 TaxID=3062676 RepID=UPI0026E35F60|nr:hypothetical protein [Colwellia sp. 6_MG-2023]MDO6487911.1 hypothetical protein [Colwellia sp. 6_MG-2023]
MINKQSLSQYKVYWKAKSIIKYFIFNIKLFKYSVANYLRSKLELFNSLSRLFQSVLSYFLPPMLVAFTLQYFQPAAQELHSKIGGHLLNVSEYGTFLATITSICGIFIGLYYAAITSISGAIYARVPQNIRNLLLREKMGNAYMRFLAMFTFLGIILLALYIMGGKPNPFTPSIIAIFSGLAVYSFIYIGMKAFTLFDPTSLATDVVLQLKKSLINAVAGATYWDSPEFQNHERIKAENYIDTLEVLADIAEKERHLSGQVLVEFCEKLIWFLQWNELEKSKIPSDSHWFESKLKHPNWYQTSDSETSMMNLAGASLSAKVIKDHDWIENRLLDIILNSLKLNLKENRFVLVQKLYDLLNKYVATCAYNGRISYALELINKTSAISEEQVIGTLAHTKNKQSLELIAVCDAVAMLPITALLSFSRSIETKNSDSNHFELFNKFNWKLSKDIYHLGFSPKTVENLEWLQKRIKFEIEVEKKLITPDWYINNIVFKSEAESFCRCVTVLFEDITKLYAGWSAKLSSTDRYWLAASCVTREKEFIFKLNKHLSIFETYWNSIIKYKKHDEYWPEFKLDTLILSQEKRIEKIDIMSGDIASSLISEEKPDDYPDFAGQFLHSLSEAVFKASLDNNNEKLLTLFHLCFTTTFAQAQKLMPLDVKEEWVRENLTKVAFTPIIDLIDLSGYCILMSEYYGNTEIRRIVDVYWNGYFGKVGSLKSAQVEIIFATIATFDQAYEIPHRNQYRSRWERIINNKLNQNVECKSVIGNHRFNEDIIRLHDSPLVRIFSEDKIALRHNGIDVFYTYILKPMLSEAQCNLINRRRNLADELQREIEFYAKYNEGKE